MSQGYWLGNTQQGFPSNLEFSMQFLYDNKIYLEILRDYTMDVKIIYIPYDVKQNYPFCS